MNDALVHPDLYVAGQGGNVRLLGMACTECEHVAFPRQRYGCEKCGAGADSLQDIDLDAKGMLASYATVYVHQAKSIAAPFVIGEIKLERGPTVRATMVEPSDRGMMTGARVTGRLYPVPSTDGSASRLELRFAVESPT